MSSETVNHPAHYGGADNPYEAIKVIEAWSLGFCLGNCVKYICRAGKKLPSGPGLYPDSPMRRAQTLEDLRKALWYLQREIAQLENTDTKPEHLKNPTFIKGMCNYKEGFQQCILTSGHQERSHTLHTDPEGLAFGGISK